MAEDIPESFRTQEDSSSYICGWKPFIRPNLYKLGKWKLAPNNSKIPWNDQKAIQKVHPVIPYDHQKVTNPPLDKIQITWIGHATVLVQIEGLNILADPVFSNRAGPGGFGIKLGYKRFRPPACEVKDLPRIHVVIISHNHHDHLDSQSVKDIARLHPNAKWFVGLGNKTFCLDKGCKDVEEMNWWQSTPFQSTTFPGFNFVCTPTQHWCQRYPLDFNDALWCGWVVHSPNYKYYFAGETGYQEELFKLIGRKYGPFHLASLPIGAYEPRYITEFQQVNPEEAVRIHKDIRSKISVGMHWGTFELTNEYYLEPPQQLEKEMYLKMLDPKTFFNLQIGETWIIGKDRDYDPPFMEREKERTQKLSNDTREGGAKGNDRHVVGDDRDHDPPFMERVKERTLKNDTRQGGATGNDGPVVGKDRDYDPPFMEREKKGSHKLNNDTRQGAATGNDNPVKKNEKLEASPKLNNSNNAMDNSGTSPEVQNIKPTGRSRKKHPETETTLQIGETRIVGEDRYYDPPFMARENKQTQRPNDGNNAIDNTRTCTEVQQIKPTGRSGKKHPGAETSTH